ncbi:hypothetical protein EDB89DRAFT_933549 [Lactarius sanguifluus]|nr:hypothetical protein EDB89DRAFT_933549 [Lactarius sanguifluus]
MPTFCRSLPALCIVLGCSAYRLFTRYCVLTLFINLFLCHHHPVLHVLYMRCPPLPCRRSQLHSIPSYLSLRLGCEDFNDSPIMASDSSSSFWHLGRP